MSGQIVISYRREESRWSARILRDRLGQHFGPKQIFMDIDAIALGEDFVEVIETTVAKCDVLIAVIGNNWLTSKDKHGNRRLDNPEDFVRMEIGTALKRKIRVIPVLVDGASMPQATELPEDLKLLVRRNALPITDTSFDGDCRRLTEAITLVLEKAAAEEQERLTTKQRRREEAESRQPEEKERVEAERRQHPEQERLRVEQRHHKYDVYQRHYKYDVYISYARVHDGWVSSFKQRLEQTLREKLPGETAQVYLDVREIGVGPLKNELRDAVSSSAILLIVLSNRWLERSWCQQELAFFVEAAGGPSKAQERIVLVRIEDVKQNRLPAVLQDCRLYNFFRVHPTRKITLMYGLPEFPELESDYLISLLELVGDEDRGLVTRLQELNEKTGRVKDAH